jgi:hypothetical protein
VSHQCPAAFFFWERFSLYRPGWPGSPYVAQVGLKLSVLLPQPNKCRDHRGMCLSI